MSEAKSPAKILFMLPTLDAGGAERVLITLMNGLDYRKYEPEFLSVGCGGVLRELIDPSIKVHTLDKKPVPYMLPFLPALYKKIKEVKPDIIVSTMAHMNFSLLLLKSFFPDTVFIVREAITPSFLFQKYKRTNWIIKQLYKKLYPRADLILSPTQTVFDEFYYDLRMKRHNFFLLKNPVNVFKIRSSAGLANNINVQENKHVHFVACGRLGKQKGFDRLIEALDQFKPPFCWRLDILGEGHERPVLEALIQKKGLEDRVFLKGLVMPPYSYMAQADCFLMPSRYEGLPNAVLESLACGTPVIATRESGGIAEIAKDCAVGSVNIVDDMKEFIEAMGKVVPHGKQTPAPSLLANCYDQKKVFDEFENILHLATMKQHSLLSEQVAKMRGTVSYRKNQVSEHYSSRPDLMRKVILNVGCLDFRKDQKILIKAFAQIAPYFPEWDLRIIGEGELKEELQTLVRQYDLDDRIFLPGVPDTISAEYEVADIFAVSSRDKSCDLATKKALTYGVPVLGFTDCPGTNEVVQSGYNGLLVNSHDRAGVLAKGLQHLIQNPALRARYGMNGSKRAEYSACEQGGHNWENLLSQIKGNSINTHPRSRYKTGYGVATANQDSIGGPPKNSQSDKSFAVNKK